MKRAVCLLMAMVISMALLCACGKVREGAKLALWETQIENLQWGMSKVEIQNLYQCTEEEGTNWKAETVREKYEKEALKEAYASVFGEGVIGDTYLDGILASPLVFYELRKTDEGCRFVIDATVKEEMKYIFGSV